MPEPLPDYRELGSWTRDCSFAWPPGVWRAELLAKAWGRNRNILLYFFDLERRQKYCISLYRLSYYCPENRSFDFRKNGRRGDIFEVEIGLSGTGKTRLLSARLVDTPAAQEPQVTPAS